MQRLMFGQLLIVLSLSANLFASELKQQLLAEISELNQENCTELLSEFELKLNRKSRENYIQEISVEGHESLLHSLWESKVYIHERLRTFYATSLVDDDCAVAARGAFRAIRTAEDYIAENLVRTNKTFKFPDNAFGKGNLHVRRHPDMVGFDMLKDLKTGDIILTRGDAFTSAAIASLGEFDTQFSHMSIVYRDKKNKLWTVEAHIEVGVFVRPIEDHIKDKNSRTMIFRYNDQGMAAKAGKYIFNKVLSATKKKGNINYDFGFDQDNKSSLYCSEVVSLAFEEVSAGRIHIPMWRSRLFERKPEFIKSLGITAKSSFIPSDIEIDPRFKMIAEWRDANRISDGLEKDAIISAMFQWSDRFGYEMKQGSSGKSKLYRNLAWPLRRIPFLRIIFKDKLPLNMTRRLIGYFGVIESVGDLLQKELKAADERSVKSTGMVLMKSSKQEVLDNFRLSELNQKKSKLHKMFRPKD